MAVTIRPDLTSVFIMILSNILLRKWLSRKDRLSRERGVKTLSVSLPHSLSRKFSRFPGASFDTASKRFLLFASVVRSWPILGEAETIGLNYVHRPKRQVKRAACPTLPER